MARKKRDYKRIVLADPKFHETLVTKFINTMMWEGKRSLAESIFYGALDTVQERFQKEGVQVFQDALNNVRPLVEVRSRRVGGATYQVPTEVRPERRLSMALRWMVGAARARSGKPIAQRLYEELLDASRGQGASVRRREDLHRMAEANRAFVHYR